MRENLKRSYSWRRLNATASADTSFDTIKIPTLTKPSGNGVVDIMGNDPHWSWSTDGLHVPEKLLIIPYGTDANNETFSLRIYGWQRCEDVADLWIPVLLTELAVTHGSIAGTALLTGSFIADTIAVTHGAGVATEHTDSTELPGFVELDLMGLGMLEFDFDMTGAASGNVLLKPLY